MEEKICNNSYNIYIYIFLNFKIWMTLRMDDFILHSHLVHYSRGLLGFLGVFCIVFPHIFMKPIKWLWLKQTYVVPWNLFASGSKISNRTLPMLNFKVMLKTRVRISFINCSPSSYQCDNSFLSISRQCPWILGEAHWDWNYCLRTSDI